MRENFDPNLRKINEARFRAEAEEKSGKPPFIRRVFGMNNKDPRGSAEEEARALNRWRDIEKRESESPLNDLARENGEKIYRPYILDNPRAVEAYANHDPRWRLGFSLSYGLSRMFGGVPGKETSARLLGGMEEDKIKQESYNELVLRAVEQKLRNRKDGSAPLRILELAAGRTYGELSYKGLYDTDMSKNYGAPWISRLLKMKFGDAVDVSVVDLVNDRVMHPDSILDPQEDPGAVVVDVQGGTLGFRDDLRTEIPRGAAGAASIFPVKEFVPTSVKDGHALFPRPRLDPVVEKMLFGVNAYGNVNMRTNENIRAIMGDANGTFDFIFAKNAYSLPTIRQIAELMSDHGMYMSGGFWQGDTYFPLDNIAEKNGKKMEVPKSHYPAAFDAFLQEKGLWGEGESIYRADGDELGRQAAELLSLVKEGFSRGAAEAISGFDPDRKF